MDHTKPAVQRRLFVALTMFVFCMFVVCGCKSSFAATGDYLRTLRTPNGSRADRFGGAVAIDLNRVVIGAYLDDDHGSDAGAAYIFDVASGAELHKLLASDGTAGDFFGSSVSISKELAIIGSQYVDAAAHDSGAAYVFNVSRGEQLSKLIPSDPVINGRFGISTAIDDGLAVVGASGALSGGIDSGAAYIFDPVTGLQLRKLVPGDLASQDGFGFSVAMDSSVVVIGAPSDDDKGPNSGSAYIFDVKTGRQLRKLTPADGESGDLFGFSVAIDRGIVVVGSLRDDDNGYDSGAAYVFDASSGGQLAKLKPADGNANDQFGASVSIADNIAVIGSPDDDAFLEFDAGSAYIFDLSRRAQLGKLFASDRVTDGAFGISVSVAGGIAVVGTALNSAVAPFGSGSVDVFSVVPEPSALRQAILFTIMSPSFSRRSSSARRRRETTSKLGFHLDLNFAVATFDESCRDMSKKGVE